MNRTFHLFSTTSPAPTSYLPKICLKLAWTWLSLA